jgi:hypothetical protein
VPAEGTQDALAAVESIAAAAYPAVVIAMVATVVVEEVLADYVVVTIPVEMVVVAIEYNAVVVATAAAVGSNNFATSDCSLGHSAYIHIAHCLALHLHIVMHLVWY